MFKKWQAAALAAARRPSARAQAAWRRNFRRFNRLMVFLWRLGLGRWIDNPVTGRIMVLEHIGRRSGRCYHTPVNYARINGRIYCLAGFGDRTDWYRNLVAHPEVRLWLPDGRYSGRVTDASEAPERLAALRQVLIASGPAALAVGLRPATMSNEALAWATEYYRLIRIDRLAPARPGPGPGDLAWIWPLMVFFLLRRTGVTQRPYRK